MDLRSDALLRLRPLILYAIGNRLGFRADFSRPAIDGAVWVGVAKFVAEYGPASLGGRQPDTKGGSLSAIQPQFIN
jgi:hypothetical protein